MNAPAPAPRRRWVEWLNVPLWLALGMVGGLYIPTLRPLYDTWGGDIPIITKLMLWGRPVYLLFMFGAVLAGVRLWNGWTPPRRRAWAALGLCLFLALMTAWAVFAPMFMGTLAEGTPR